MKSLGITRPVDSLGRVVLPIELQRAMGIDTGDAVEIFTDQEQVILRKYQPGCIFCGGMIDTRKFRGQVVCDECRVKLAAG